MAGGLIIHGRSTWRRDDRAFCFSILRANFFFSTVSYGSRASRKLTRAQRQRRRVIPLFSAIPLFDVQETRLFPPSKYRPVGRSRYCDVYINCSFHIGNQETIIAHSRPRSIDASCALCTWKCSTMCSGLAEGHKSDIYVILPPD